MKLLQFSVALTKDRDELISLSHGIPEVNGRTTIFKELNVFSTLDYR